MLALNLYDKPDTVEFTRMFNGFHDTELRVGPINYVVTKDVTAAILYCHKHGVKLVYGVAELKTQCLPRLKTWVRRYGLSTLGVEVKFCNENRFIH